ncbi:MAG: hypothetical protein J6R04_04215 [Clostridia bacterium]|nr:hypothetical protein [Clostridia bacterium]
MKDYHIQMKDVTREDVRRVQLCLENCETIDFFQDEIEELDVECSPELVFAEDGIMRCVVGGTLIVRLNPQNDRKREKSFFALRERKYLKTQEVIDRLRMACDVCLLKIENAVEGIEETLVVPYEEMEDDETGDVLAVTVSSSARLLDDDRLMILMGDRSEYPAGAVEA